MLDSTDPATLPAHRSPTPIHVRFYAFYSLKPRCTFCTSELKTRLCLEVLFAPSRGTFCTPSRHLLHPLEALFAPLEALFAPPRGTFCTTHHHPCPRCKLRCLHFKLPRTQFSHLFQATIVFNELLHPNPTRNFLPLHLWRVVAKTAMGAKPEPCNSGTGKFAE